MMYVDRQQMTSHQRQSALHIVWTWDGERVGTTGKFFIVDGSVLPEIFVKVVEAKRLLETGEVSTINQAAAQAGVSRSAFYKYKDMVRPFNDMLSGRIVTLQLTLKDRPGVLSDVLNLIASSGGNLLTINQTIPANGAAGVSVGMETSHMAVPLEEFLTKIAKVSGVLRCETLAGQ